MAPNFIVNIRTLAVHNIFAGARHRSFARGLNIYSPWIPAIFGRRTFVMELMLDHCGRRSVTAARFHASNRFDRGEVKTVSI